MPSSARDADGPSNAAERAARRQARRERDGRASEPLPAPAGGRWRDQRRGAALWFALTVAVLVLVLIIRLITLTPANVALHSTATGTLTVPGHAPRPDFPVAGEAALSVEGIGSLGSSGPVTPVPTASLAKVMTAYLILARYPLSGDAGGFRVTVTTADAAAEAADAAQDESVLPVRAGETLDERQLLEGLLIPSGDNVARMLGAYAAGSDAAFVTQMNTAARRLGMRQTTYTDPSGFASTTVSTAADQLKIFRAAMGSAVFRRIVSMPAVTLPDAGTVQNYDPLIAEGYDGKTGSDSAAEGNLAFFKNESVDGHSVTMVGVVMDQGVGSDTGVILGAAGDAAATMVDSVIREIRARTILPAHSTVILATSADGRRVAAQTTLPLSVIGWGGVHEHLSVVKLKTGRGLPAGALVGDVALSGDLATPEGGAVQSPVTTTGTLGAPGLGWRLANLL